MGFNFYICALLLECIRDINTFYIIFHLHIILFNDLAYKINFNLFFLSIV